MTLRIKSVYIKIGDVIVIYFNIFYTGFSGTEVFPKLFIGRLLK